MDDCLSILITVVIVIISIVSNAKKNDNSSSSSSSGKINLDDIFNEVTNNSNKPANKNGFNQKRNNQQRRNPYNSEKQPPRIQNKESLVSFQTSTNHSEHNCEEVNYDNTSSLEGGSGSFNLGESEPSVEIKQQPKIQIEREDLLKSFIMSEVLQRYDINRIYNRIPSIKSDD